MKEGLDLSELYSLRNDFSIIALTGQTGSGCSTIASKLSKGFDLNEYPDPKCFDNTHNSYRKYRIIYDYAKENFKQYNLINYRDVVLFILLKSDFKDLLEFLSNSVLLNDQLKRYGHVVASFDKVIEELEIIEELWTEIQTDFQRDAILEERKTPLKMLAKNFFGSKFIEFCVKFHNCFTEVSKAHHYIVFQQITNNIRRCGEPYSSSSSTGKDYFKIVSQINKIVKSKNRFDKQSSTHIVIDSLRNPLEIMYFRQRFSAFYTIAVNRDDKDRIEKLRKKYEADYKILAKLIELEYNGGKGSEFHKQNVRECIEKADIHIAYRSLERARELNVEFEVNTSRFFSWEMQLLKFVALISHPGLVTPSPEERCMQLAYTAKYNSGCISRQVGATITDDEYSIKAIGWNDTPAGQVPCLLRNAESLLNKETTGQDALEEFTPYEKNDQSFLDTLQSHYAEPLKSNSQNLKGRNVCFCFKSLHNSCYDGKNQVHTRSLHAEESAFLQITKYGGTAIKNGKLFTTASPCELCSKKAYQLGIKLIYYIDPYPGISQEHILMAGNEANRPKIRLFSGAIGNAYHWLYEPLMTYKDELSLLLGLDIKDLSATQKVKIDEQQNIIDQLNAKIVELEKNK